MKPILFIPFFYFQQTRLTGLRDFIFHFAYEWLPAFLILAFASSLQSGLLNFLQSYLAFIAMYEIGYLMNDQLAYREKQGRTRSAEFSATSIVLFVIMRAAVFVFITFYTQNEFNTVWYAWYILLILAFVAHNLLQSPSLKCVTFCNLAFMRFFSPVFVFIESSFLQQLALPVFLNYVAFRLFTYMDSKNLLDSFDRKTNGFRVGFYLVILCLSAALSVASQSILPLVVNIYYLLVVSIYALLPLRTG